MMFSRSRVCVAHLAPIWMDPSRTTDKAVDAIREAAGGGAQLVAFSESFISRASLTRIVSQRDFVIVPERLPSSECLAERESAPLVSDKIQIALVNVAATAS